MLSVVNDGSTETDSLIDDIVREGARRMLAAALEAEVNAYVAELADQCDEAGQRLVVRNGYHRERSVTTAAGPIEVKAPRLNDRRIDEATGERKRFSSKILPPWCRKSPKVAEVLPLLYLHGLSSGDFVPALEQFLGSSAGLSPATVTRLTKHAASKVDPTGQQDPHRGFPTRSGSDLKGTRGSRSRLEICKVQAVLAAPPVSECTMVNLMPSPRHRAGNGGAGSPRTRTDGGAPPRTRLPQLRRTPVNVRFDRREALTAAGIYLAIAVTGFGLLMAISHFRGYHATDVLTRWDSARYLHIAEHGYPNHLEYTPGGLPKPSALAFFPMVPALIRAVHLVTFLPFPYAGVVVSWSMAAIAAAGVHTLAGSLFGRRAGYACVGLWACSPYAFALWVPYSEATFTAFLMWTLIAVVARRWLWAGVLCALAGTVRPTSTVLVGVVVISAIRALMLHRAGWRPWAAMGIAPLGLIFSWLYLGSRIGRLDGWFIAEKAWGQQFDFGLGSLRFLQKLITYQNTDIRYPLVLTVILTVAVGVVALALDRQVPWPLVLALAGAWELMFGTPGAPLSKPRFILPFLPIMLLLVMRPIARLPRTVQGCLYGSGAIFAGWYAFGLLVLFKHPP